MPHSLRAKLSGLRYKGILEDKDYKRLCKALENEDVLEKISQEIEEKAEWYNKNLLHEHADLCNEILQIIDKYTKGDTE